MRSVKAKQEGGSHEGQVHDHLPEDGLFGDCGCPDLDESFQQMDGGNADKRRGEFHFEDAGIDV